MTIPHTLSTQKGRVGDMGEHGWAEEDRGAHRSPWVGRRAKESMQDLPPTVREERPTV